MVKENPPEGTEAGTEGDEKDLKQKEQSVEDALGKSKKDTLFTTKWMIPF